MLILFIIENKEIEKNISHFKLFKVSYIFIINNVISAQSNRAVIYVCNRKRTFDLIRAKMKSHKSITVLRHLIIKKSRIG